MFFGERLFMDIQGYANFCVLSLRVYMGCGGFGAGIRRIVIVKRFDDIISLLSLFLGELSL